MVLIEEAPPSIYLDNAKHYVRLIRLCWRQLIHICYRDAKARRWDLVREGIRIDTFAILGNIRWGLVNLWWYAILTIRKRSQKSSR